MPNLSGKQQQWLVVLSYLAIEIEDSREAQSLPPISTTFMQRKFCKYKMHLCHLKPLLLL
jgi:hypothetical protein